VTPILAKAFDNSGLGKLSRSLKLIYLIGGVPVAGLLMVVLIFTPQLLYLLKGETYLPYADGMYLMTLFYGFLFINRPLQMVFRAIRQGKQVFLANILATISMFTAGIWLIKRWDLYGAIAGQALNAIIISVVLLIAWFKLANKGDLKGTSEK
jgi:O-antigen/teichoic acid export membrane protein